MIPLRIRLKGFLCYKEEQDISFDGASLWMLSGLNGSGKSAVFDAMTYALFGHHRGGSSNAQELINKKSDGLLVEFDFLQDGQAYRVHRTLQRRARGGTASGRQVYRRLSTHGNGDGSWEPIEGTDRKEGFEAWVRDKIGLNYETFTSSVLLLQNQADKLLNSGPKGRFEVLAGIVDLERYRRLHERADQRRKEQKARVEHLQNRLEALPEVGALLLVEAEARIAAAEQARLKGQEEVERLLALEHEARRWAELQGRLAQASRRWQQAQGLLADAAVIERDLARLEELRKVLPLLQTVLEQHRQLQEQKRRADEVAKHKQKFEEQLAQQDHALEQARQKRDVLQRRIADEERRHREAAAELRRLVGLLGSLKQYEEEENELARLEKELKQLPADPEADLCKARDEWERLEVISRAVPLLDRLHRQREEIGRALAREQEALKAQQAVEVQDKQYAAEVERLRPLRDEALTARQQADAEATRARTLLDEARRQRRDLELLSGAKVCRQCGQPLTPGHIKEEKVRREKLVAEAEAQCQAAAAIQKTAQAKEKQVREQLEQAEKQRTSARDQYVELRHKAEAAHKDVERLQAECGQLYDSLAESFRSRVAPASPADWLSTTFPQAADLESLRHEITSLTGARQKLREAEQVHRHWSELKTKQEVLRQTLDRLRAQLPPDYKDLRRQHAHWESEEQALDRSLTACRKELAQTQKDLDRLTAECNETRNQLTRLEEELKMAARRRQDCEQALERALKQLSPAWRESAERAGLADVESLSQERDALVAKQVEERGRQLQQARVGVDVIQQELTDLQRQIAEVPAGARQGPAQIQALLQTARQAQRAREDEVSQARQLHHRLESQRQEREQVQQQLLEAERELGYLKTLAELLGRNRLQLHLVRQAERQVVDHANAVLDRLSGGELYLRLVGEAGGEGDSERALDLEVQNRTSSEQPINVAFLSGSQKFRVAVSLALGIGQYASRQHRPLESVIIDEGFGCLDKNGRQVMIQELQNLRNQLRCILLVSHQEEFADAFADGYRFDLQDGTTVATRFQR
jgi:exonuclease SbcC